MNGRTAYCWKEGMKNQRPSRTALFTMAEKGVAVQERVFGEGHYLRPQFIQPYRCQNVLIDGVTIKKLADVGDSSGVVPQRDRAECDH